RPGADRARLEGPAGGPAGRGPGALGRPDVRSVADTMGGLTSRAAAPARAWQRRPSVEPAPAKEADRSWDVLLLCIAGYLLTSVGRGHQLFPVLESLRPGMLTGGLGLLIFLFGRPEARRSR